MNDLVKAFTAFADNLVEIVTGNLPNIISAVTNAISDVTSIDPSALQGEITEAIGSNPFAILKTLSTIKNNASAAMGIKRMLEVLLHNIKTLVLGLKDGMYKGLQEGKSASPKQIQGDPNMKPIEGTPGAIQIQVVPMS